MAQVRALVASKLSNPIDIAVKLNTGMNRLGFDVSELSSALRLLKRNASVAGITLMTHFADADGASGIADQLTVFRKAVQGLDLPLSMANSAAILRYPESHGDWVRPGIMLYGSSPFPGATAESFGLKPVMSLHSKLIATRSLKAGDSVGYGGIFTAPKSMRIGIVACGYADGYPRHAPTGVPIVVGGVRTRTVGRVSMDKICVDLEPVPKAEAGTPVLLWGSDGKSLLSADEVAAAAGTISYELFCSLARRVPIEEIGG
jgi:alanine racemase